jgi:hypothetical protein
MNNDDIFSPSSLQEVMRYYARALSEQIHHANPIWSWATKAFTKQYSKINKKRRDQIAVAIRMGGQGNAAKAYPKDQVDAVYYCHPALQGMASGKDIWIKIRQEP